MLTKYATYIHIITCMNMINKSVIQQKGNEYAKTYDGMLFTQNITNSKDESFELN